MSGGGDNVSVVKWARDVPRGDQPGHVGHVGQEVSTVLSGDLKAIGQNVALTQWSQGDLGPVSIRKTVFPGMGIPMLKIRRPVGRLIFNMGIAIPGKTVFLIETAPWMQF